MDEKMRSDIGFWGFAAIILTLIILSLMVFPYALWWALTYLHLINIEWNWQTWLAFTIILTVIGGIGARFTH